MYNLDNITINKILLVTTVVTVLSFFSLLVIANVTSRKGIEEIGTYQKEIQEYDRQIRKIDSISATYSSLIRIESRAREMGLTSFSKTEYLK